MSRATDHYARHLADHYAWLMGGAASAMTRAAAELDALGLVADAAPGRVLDLGAGFGAHSVPLSRRGYEVVAVDTSPELLGALRAGASASIETVETDLLEAVERAAGAFDAVLCMGDTLTHLDSEEDVARLLRGAVDALSRRGRFIATYRDYTGLDEEAPRFFTVRSDQDRIATCGLEARGARVRVHDILHEREGAAWTARSSTYEKLRLDPAWVREELSAAGASARGYDAPSGMVGVEATRT